MRRRRHRFIQDALKEIRDRVAKETGLVLLAGWPSKSPRRSLVDGPPPANPQDETDNNGNHYQANRDARCCPAS